MLHAGIKFIRIFLKVEPDHNNHLKLNSDQNEVYHEQRVINNSDFNQSIF
jgi:hypothetical protein